MADYIKKIRTESGDLQIDYTSLANLPTPDSTLAKSGYFADAKAVGDKITTVNNAINTLSSSKADKTSVPTKVSQLVDDIGVVTETELSEKNYATIEYVNSSGTATTIKIGTVTTGSAGSSASASITGSNGNYTLNLTIPRGDTGATGATGPKGDTGTVGTHTLDSHSNIHVCSTTPTSLTNGDWYFVKV